MSACDPCHVLGPDAIHNNVEWAVEMGYIVRLTNDEIREIEEMYK